MIEIHGWIHVVCEEPDELGSDEIFELRERASLKIEAAHSLESLSIELKKTVLNGEVMFAVFGSGNHVHPDREEAIELFRVAGSVAPRSFGILFLRNFDADGSLSDKFEVWVLRRGVLKESEDHYFSPCSERIGID